MAQTKASPVPFCEICCKSRDVARARPQIEANELIHNKAEHKNKQVGFTRL